MSVSLQHLPIAMAGDERHLLDRETGFKQSARGFMPKVLEVEILNLQLLACSPEGGAN